MQKICHKKAEANLTASAFSSALVTFLIALNRISDNKKGRRYATTLVSFYSMVDEMTGSTPVCVQSSHSNVSQHNWCARLPDVPKIFYLFPRRKSITPCQRLQRAIVCMSGVGDLRKGDSVLHRVPLLVKRTACPAFAEVFPPLHMEAHRVAENCA